MKNYQDKIKYFYEKRDYQGIARLIIGISDINNKIDVSNLLNSPLGECKKIGLVYTESPISLDQCIYGRYDDKRSEIHVYLTLSSYRNLFTLVHEIGHHLIYKSDEWALASYDFAARGDREKIEEEIANAIASEILIPSPVYQNILPKDNIDAKNISDLYNSVTCSPEALLYRIQKELNNTQDSIIGVSSLKGEYFQTYSLREGNEKLLPLARKIKQKALSEVGIALQDSEYYEGTPRECIVNGLGFSRGNYHINAARIKGSDKYFFCMKPSKSILSSNSSAVVLCSSCSREIEDLFDFGNKKCSVCKEFTCSECSKCPCQEIECPPCEVCFITLNVAETVMGKTVHDDCE